MSKSNQPDLLSQLAALSAVSSSLSQSLTLDEMLASALEQVLKVMTCKAGLVNLVNAQTDKLVLSAHQGLPQAMSERFEKEGLDGTLCDLVYRGKGDLGIGDLADGAPVDVSGLLAAGLRAYLGTPLAVKGRMLGTLCIFDRRPRHVTQEDFGLMQAIGNQIAVAVENTRLLEQTQRQLADLRTIQETISQLTAAPTFEEAINVLLPQVTSIVQAQTASLFLIEGEKMIRVGGYSTIEGEAPPIGQTNLLADYPLTRRVIETRQPNYNVADDPRLQPHAREAFKASGITANATIPLVGRESVLGVLSVSLYQPGRNFSEHDVSVLQTVADQATIALEKGRLFDQIQRRTVQLRAAAEVSHAASSTLDVAQLASESVNLIRDHFDLYFVGLFLLDTYGKFAVLRAGTGDAGQAMLKSGHKLEIGGPSMIGQCLSERQARITLDASQESIRFDNPLLPDTRSEMALPLISRGQVLGALTVQSTQRAAFSNEDIAALQTMADQLTNAIANAQQFELTERARAEADKRVAALNCLNDIGRKIEESPPVQELLPWVAAHIPPVMQYPHYCVVAIEYQGQTYGEPEAKDLPRQVVQSFYVGDESTGRIYVAYRETLDFLDEESALLGDIARRVSGYIENQRLLQETQAALDETEEQANHLALLNEISQHLSRATNLDEILNVSAVKMSQLFSASRASVALLTDKGDSFEVLALQGKEGAVSTGAHLPIEGTAIGMVVRENRLIVTPDTQASELLDLIHMAEHGIRSTMSAPLFAGGRAMGTLNVGDMRLNAYTGRDGNLLLQLASLLSSTIENRRLLEQTQRQLANLETIQTAIAHITAASTFDEAIEVLLPQVATAVWAETVNMFLVEGEYMIRIGAHSTAGRKDLGIGEVNPLDDYPLTKNVIETRQPQVLTVDDPRLQPHSRQAYQAAGVAVSATIPLVGRERVLGFLTLHRHQGGQKFAEHEVNLIQTLANQATTALEKSRLLEQIQHRTTQLRASVEVSRAASSILEVDALLEQSVNLIRDQFDYYYVGLFLVNGDGTIAHLRAGTGQPGQTMLQRGHEFEIGGQSMIGQCIADGQARIALDVGQEAVRFDNPLLPDTRSELALPLVSRGVAIGALSIQSSQEVAFTEEDVAVLQTMAGQLATAIENAHLFEQTQVQLADLATIQTTLAQITAASTFEEAIEILLPQVLDAIKADTATMSLVEGDQLICVGLLPPDAREGFYVGRVDPLDSFPMTKRIVETRQSDFGSTTDPDIQPHARASFEASGITANATIPLVGRERVVGILSVNLRQPGRDFSEHDINLLQTLANQATTALEKNRLLEQIQRRTVQLRASVEVSQAVSSTLKVDALLEQSVNLISDRFDYYYVGLFLVDKDDRFAHLRAGSGQAGQTMLQRGHKLKVGGRSMIGQCIADGQAQVALDVGREAVRFDNPLLPETRSEMALPLVSRGMAIGALSIQSSKQAAFTEEDIAILQTVASQLATAIENARLLERTQTALQEIEATQQRYVRQAWEGHVSTEKTVQGYLRSGDKEGPTTEDWLPAMTTAVQQLDTVIEQDAQTGSTLAIPLTVHGEVIGALGGSRPDGQEWSKEDIAAAEAIVEQIALALENQRLFDEAQQATSLMSERVKALNCLNDIGRKMEEIPPIADFLPWVTDRVPRAMRHSEVCVAAIEFEGRAYGVAEAVTLPCHIVQTLRVGGESVGHIYVAYTQDREFLDEESALLGGIARRVSGYIENQQLLRDTQARAEELSVLNEMARALTTTLDVEGVIESLYDHASRLIDTTNFYVALYDAETDEVWFPFYAEGDQIRRVERRRTRKGMTEHIIHTRQPMLIKENVSAALKELGIDLIGTEAQSWLGVPMMIGDRILGVIAVQNYTTPGLYTERHRDLLTAVASQTAIAIQNARSFEQTQAALEQVQAVHQRYLRESWEGYLSERTQAAQPAYLYEVAQIMPQPDLRLPEIDRALAQKKLIVGDGKEGGQTIALPISLRGQTIGALAVEAPAGRRQWSEEEIALIEAVSTQLALALENTRLFEETQMRAQRERILREVTDRVRAAGDMESLLRSAAQEIRRALGASSATIRLGIDDDKSSSAGTQ